MLKKQNHAEKKGNITKAIFKITVGLIVFGTQEKKRGKGKIRNQGAMKSFPEEPALSGATAKDGPHR